MKDATSPKALEYFYSQRVLTEYLQTLSDKELLQAEMNLMVDDIIGDRIGILDAIRQEKEYRIDGNIETNIKKPVK